MPDSDQTPMILASRPLAGLYVLSSFLQVVAPIIYFGGLLMNVPSVKHIGTILLMIWGSLYVVLYGAVRRRLRSICLEARSRTRGTSAGREIRPALDRLRLSVARLAGRP